MKRLQLDSHTHRPRRLNNIGNSFLWRFARPGDFADLDEAIMAQEAVRLTPKWSPSQAQNLGFFLLTRLKHQPDGDTLSQAAAVFS